MFHLGRFSAADGGRPDDSQDSLLGRSFRKPGRVPPIALFEMQVSGEVFHPDISPVASVFQLFPVEVQLSSRV